MDQVQNQVQLLPGAGKVFCLRTCDKYLKGYGGFQWPSSGEVEATDWSSVPCCGHGLHGLARGVGGHDYLSSDPDAVWLVVEVEESDLVVITEGGTDKVKFPRGTVVYAGEKQKAVEIVKIAYPALPVVFSTATAGDSGTATAGYSGTATAGDSGTATAGDRGTATAGDRGTATAGDSGTATAGDSGTATAGNRGTATAGDSGTATAGYRGTATAGEYGALVIAWYDEKAGKIRKSVAIVGENNILPNVKYKLSDGGIFVRAD